MIALQPYVRARLYRVAQGSGERGILEGWTGLHREEMAMSPLRWYFRVRTLRETWRVRMDGGFRETSGWSLVCQDREQNVRALLGTVLQGDLGAAAWTGAGSRVGAGCSAREQRRREQRGREWGR